MEFKHNPTESTRITRIFGKQEHPITHIVKDHNGIDIGAIIAGKQGDPLYAVSDGTVIISKVNGGGVDVGYGYYVVIQHVGFATLYGHMQGLIVKVGQVVKAGQIIGHMGNTGTSTATHLHFGLTEGEYAEMKWINPEPYFLKEVEEEMTQEQFNEFFHNMIVQLRKQPPQDWSEEDRT